MQTIHFYENLHVVQSFRDVADPHVYTSLPDDWFVALADVRSSTDAIRLGKYKEVNMAGASIIAALNNLYREDYLLPYLFSGDGALIVLPSRHIDEARSVLAACRNAVQNAYGLELAVGLVSMRTLREAGHDIGLARLKLSEYMDQPIFWGSGVTYAEEFIKRQDTLALADIREADFSGLECRWSQVPSDKDEVAVYLIQAAGANDVENALIYEECFRRIDAVYGASSDFHPLRRSSLDLTTSPRLLGVEWKLRTQPPTIGRKLKYGVLIGLQLISGLYLMAFNKQTAETRWGDYKTDLIRHADYRKFGDGLRFIANGTVQQRMDLSGFLEQQFNAGKLAYGTHSSFAAMITCYVKSYQSNHIHFVDGTDGGYAKASQELKNRRSRLKTPSVQNKTSGSPH